MNKVLLVFSILFLTTQCQSQNPDQNTVITTIDKGQFKTLLQDSTYLLLDVRTPEEFIEGHIARAKNIDVEADTFEELIKKLNPSQPILVYCRTGKRSMIAAEIMKKNKFIKIINLKGGYEGWVEN